MENVFTLYTEKKNKIDIIFKIEEIINFLSLEEVELTNKIKDNKIYKDELTFIEYAYAVVEYIYYNKRNIFSKLSNELFNKYSNLRQDKYGNISYLGEINRILKYNETNCLNFKFNLNNELYKKVIEDMNSNYNKLERIVYYYFKLCLILEMSKEYYIDEEFNSNHIGYKRDKKRLENISLDNNSVVCYEFVLLMNKFLELENCLYKECSNNSYKDNSHENIVLIIDKQALMFDAIYGSKPDIISVKMNLGYNIDNYNDYNEDIKNTIAKVYNDIKDNRTNIIAKPKYNKDLNNKYIMILNCLDITKEEKESLIDDFNEINNIPLNNMDYIVYLFSKNGGNYNKLFKEKYNNISLNRIITNFNNYNFGYILSIKEKINYKYILFCRDDIILLTKEQIEELLNKGIIIPEKNHYLNGIDISLQFNIFDKEEDKYLTNLSTNTSKNTKKKLLTK